eukprot:3509322-Pyramimonas_sp.AAC.1
MDVRARARGGAGGRAPARGAGLLFLAPFLGAAEGGDRGGRGRPPRGRGCWSRTNVEDQETVATAGSRLAANPPRVF